jgi:polyhydroxyalkanoate synthesis regulator phasin
MNSDTLTQLLQKGFRVTLGATATLVEALQDPERREASVSKLTTELSQLAEILESKGANAEVEARNFVSTLWQQGASSPTPEAGTGEPSPTSANVQPEVQQDLQELTAQIAAIRAEIESLQRDES